MKKLKILKLSPDSRYLQKLALKDFSVLGRLKPLWIYINRIFKKYIANTCAQLKMVLRLDYSSSSTEGYYYDRPTEMIF